MPRIRTIKPEFWTDGNMVQLSPYARLFYIGTWNFTLCDAGHLPDDPMALKLRILPADPVDAGELMRELLAAGRIVRRRLPGGRSYLLIPRFTDHQKLDARWSPRCPYCSAEPDGFTEDPASPTETRQTSPKLPETPRTPAQERTGRDRTGKDVPPSAGALTPRPDESVTQRSKRIADAYAAVEPMCKWPAINGVVIKAIKSQKFTDEEIRDGLLRLAAEGRSVTVETLRVELAGIPPGNAVALRNGQPKASTTDQRVAQALAAGERVQAQLDRQTRTREVTDGRP